MSERPNGSSSPLSKLHNSPSERAPLSAEAEAAILGDAAASTPEPRPEPRPRQKESRMPDALRSKIASAAKVKVKKLLFHTRLDEDLFDYLNALKDKNVDKVFVVNAALRAFLNMPEPD